jgi:hypothetical protein
MPNSLELMCRGYPVGLELQPCTLADSLANRAASPFASSETLGGCQRSVPGLTRTSPLRGKLRRAEIHQSPEYRTKTHVPRAKQVGSSSPAKLRPPVVDSTLTSATSGVIIRIESIEKIPWRVSSILANYAPHQSRIASRPTIIGPLPITMSASSVKNAATPHASCVFQTCSYTLTRARKLLKTSVISVNTSSKVTVRFLAVRIASHTVIWNCIYTKET